MKNLSKVLALVLVVAMVFSLAVSASAATSFKDDADIDYSEAVELLTSLGVISGYDTDNDGVGDTFRPDGSITRAELCVLISYVVSNSRSQTPLYSDINKLNSDYKSLCTFADSKNHWAAGFIAFCATNGYISGHNANTFDPNGSITGAQVATILLRAMGYNAKAENMGTVAGTSEAANTLRLASSAGLTKGMPTNYNFFGAITRQEAAQMILNMLNGNPVQYDNGGFNMTVTGADGSTTTITSNSKREYVTKTVVEGDETKIVLATMWDYCFRGIAKQNAVVNGVSGYYWVDTANNNAKLTDLVVTDKVTATFEAGTKLTDIAKTLGISSLSDKVITEAWYNDFEHTGANLSITDMLGAGDTLADNASLSVVKNGNNDFKFVLTMEYVAKVEKASRPVSNTADKNYGKYLYTFTGWNGTSNVEVAKVYAADGAYVNGAYYVVVPSITSYNVPVSANAALSIESAEVVSNIKATSAQDQDLADATYFNVGTTRYYVSALVNDVSDDGVQVGESFTAVLNSAGYVAVICDPDQAVASTESGYVYVDLDNFQITTKDSSLIDGSSYTWSAVAKARAYFANQLTATIIDLKVETTTENGKVTAASINGEKVWGAGADAKYEDATSLGLKGFYSYDKYEDGTYTLTKVDLSTSAGTATGTVFDPTVGSNQTITSATTATVYTFTGSALTAQTYTGANNIPSGSYNVAKANSYGIVTNLVRFVEPNVASTTYAYYAGEGDWDAVLGATKLFYINGEAVSYQDKDSKVNGSEGDIYTLTLSGGVITDASKVVTDADKKITVAEDQQVWYIGNGYIVFGADKDNTTSMPVASDYTVYNAYTGNGAVDDLHLDDVVSYVAVNGVITNVWITAYAG